MTAAKRLRKTAEAPHARGDEQRERQVRGARLVEKVLEAAIEELSQKGYRALSIEEVAERAAVAKTTIYRRWPTKAALARDAIARIGDDVIRIVDTGSLRGDLLALLRAFRTFAMSPRGRSMLRMGAVEGLDSELADVVADVRKSKEALPVDMVRRAVARGELPRGTDAQLVVDTAVGALQHCVLFIPEGAPDARLEAIVDLVLYGAVRGGAAKAARRPVRAAKRTR